MRVVKVFQWDAAHKLCLPYESPCNNFHGHTYKVEIEMEGDLNDEGMVIDFKQLKQWVESVSFDHTTLNDIPDFKELNPTAELLVKYLHKELVAIKERGAPYIRRIRVWETPTSYAEEVWDVTRAMIHKHIKEDNENKKKIQESLTESAKQLEKLTKEIGTRQARG